MNSPSEANYLANHLNGRGAFGQISVRGARTHNLKNIDVDIPRNQLVVITGLSGSGKSSLAFDTLYAEGQRRYVESLSAYARQFLQRMDKPDVDLIEGLSPAIAIEQKATSHNPRSTVGTVTEIHDYLRLLFARAGTPHCPQHGVPLQASSVSQMVDAVLALPAETRILLMAPVARERKGEFAEVFAQMQAQGFVRFRIDGHVVELAELPALAKKEKHDIDVVIDRLKVRPDMAQRIAESMETALRLADGRALVLDLDTGVEHAFNAKFACPHCSFAIGELEPRLFSFNSPLGACPACEGLGEQSFFDPARIVAFPEISLASGAIKGWDKRNAYYFAMLESLANHYQFDLETPFEQLPADIQQVLLYGSGDESIKFSYVLESGSRAGRKTSKQHPFEGIVHNMARRYKDTDSALVREELSRYRGLRSCEACAGTRLRTEARHVRLGTGPQALTVHDVSHLTLSECQDYFQQLTLDGNKADIADKVVREIANRLKFLNDVGLTYLSLSRSADTLSGGEAQRIRLASQIGSGLTGVMYVLDEPSIGLHQRDNDRLIDTLKHLRDIGNSVLVVEHDEDMIRAADHCIDMGPGAGVHGGRVMAQGTPAQLQANALSLTGRYMSGDLSIAVPAHRRDWLLQNTALTPLPAKNVFGQALPDLQKHAARQALTVVGARGNNLQNVTVEFPVGLFTCVTGVSGSGKSTLVNDTLYTAVARQIHRAHEEPAPHDDILGLYHFDKVINVDQSPIG
ncbi:MAG: excinuclease ABC subunit A, partial [Betaproteobacteria bacterium]|nr:excinuclease ABC subunit A [Betaproteobacteria bacterium]